MNNYAIFTATTPNYIKHVNALLNSIEKRRLYIDKEYAQFPFLDIYVLHYGGCNKEWLNDIQKAFSFKVIPIEIKKEDVPGCGSAGMVEFVKRSRFFYISKYGSSYDAICLLDADMFIVSPDFMKLFELVDSTGQLIACNEGFKWPSNNYTLDGKPILDYSTKLYRMHCSVPIIFDYVEWKDVFEYYCKLCFKGKQGGRGIGDIYSWNISVYKCNKQDDVVVFPMETMCQVHKTYMHPNTYIQVENDYWYTRAGDRIYSIQGRWNTGENFIEGSMKWCKTNFFDAIGRNDFGKVWPKIEKGLIAIQQEWYDLNFKSKLSLEKYEPNKWQKFDRR